MAFGDIEVRAGGGTTEQFRAEDQSTASNRSATLKPGEPVKRGGTNNNFVDIVGDGDPEIGTDTLVGIVAETSTDTSSNDGTVLVHVITPGTMLRGKANDSSNLSSQSDLDGLKLDYVTFDVDGSNNVTIDENEGSDTDTHGLVIVGGDHTRNLLDVYVHNRATLFGTTVTDS